MMRISVLSLVPNPCNGASLVSSPGTANPFTLGRMLGFGALYWVSLNPKSGESFVGKSRCPRTQVLASQPLIGMVRGDFLGLGRCTYLHGLVEPFSKILCCASDALHCRGNGQSEGGDNGSLPCTVTPLTPLVLVLHHAAPAMPVMVSPPNCTTIPTASISFSKSPESSPRMLLSIGFPEIFRYSSKTAL